MRQILHIITNPHDSLAQQIVSAQQQEAEFTVKTFDLTEAEPDYRALLSAIFSSDSIQVW
jgi:hypothetical protein